MKTQVFLLCAIIFLSSQLKAQGTESTVNLNITKEIKEVGRRDTGVFPKGNGEFVYQAPMIGNGRVNRSREHAYKVLEKYAEERNLVLAISSTSFSKGLNMHYVQFNLKYEDGSPFLVKSEAIKEIKILKELLDLGILTQEEYAKKADVYKRSILEN